MGTSCTKFKKIQNTPTTLNTTLNDDLLIEILVRLPAKSIIRFKSVSKHWLSLLSDPHFTLRFDNLLISPGLFYCNLYVPFDVGNRNTTPLLHSLDLYRDPGGIKIVQSCNGLLLCRTGTGLEPNRTYYYVCNPTTKQFAVIPPVIGGDNVGASVSFMGLAFHQNDCVDYKLVCILFASWLFEIQIYSSITGNWRISRESLPASIHTAFCIYGVYWNGAIYSASFQKPFYFKLDGEHLQNMPFPDYNEKGVIPLYFGESRGHLHFVTKDHHKGPLDLNEYEMLSDHSDCFLKYQVDLQELPKAYPVILYNVSYPPTPSCTRYDYKIIDIVRGEKEDDTFMVC